VAWRTEGGVSGGSGGAGPLPLADLLPERLERGGTAGIGRTPDGTLLLFAVIGSDRGITLAAQRLEPGVRRAVEAATQVAVVFPQAGLRDGAGDVVINFDGRRMRSITQPDEPGGGDVVREDLFAETAAPPGGSGPLEATWVYWGGAASMPWVELPSLERIGGDGADAGAGAADPVADAEGLLMVVRTSFAREYFALFGGLRDTGINEEVAEGALVAIRVLLIVTLVAIALIALVAAFLVQRIAVATARLSRGFEQVRRGNFDVRAKLRGNDQLAELIAGFNRMVGGLREGIAQRAEREAIERELAVAHDLQRRLLPGVDASFPGFDVAVHFEPAAAVGGDLYQFWREDDGALRVIVGDVSGHGLATGIVMAASTALVWAQARDTKDAAELFRALDRQVRGITDARTFLTLQHCRLELQARRASVTNAGHPYPFRLSARGELSTVESSSRPLGLSLPAAFSTVEAPVEPGDLWCFYSDGLVEASGPNGEPFGFERLRSALSGCAGAGAAEARDRLLAEWRAFVGEREPDDDHTLILVRAHITGSADGSSADQSGLSGLSGPGAELGAAGPGAAGTPSQ
jgi:serine phosphatase RsbU (regulator of sigma subunit)